MSSQLILAPLNYADGAVRLSTDALRLKDSALEASALVGRVTTPAENETAVAAQKRLKEVASGFEKARVEVTKPLLRAQRTIKAMVDKELEEVQAELSRIEQMMADFFQFEEEKRRAAENAAKQAITDLERQREAEIARAASPEEADAIREHYASLAAATCTATPEPVRADGQVVMQDWEIESLNEWQLAKARPDLVRKIEFDTRAIKNALTAGEKLPGVKARKVIKTSVRTHVQQAIEV